MLLHAFKPAKMPLTASLAAAAQGLLLASVFRPLTETYGDGTSQWNKTASRRRRPEKTQEFNKERLHYARQTSVRARQTTRRGTAPERVTRDSTERGEVLRGDELDAAGEG